MTSASEPPPPLAALAANLDPNMLSTIRNAINALTTSANHQQANQYLHDLIIAPTNGWHVCVSVLASEADHLLDNANVAFYALQSIQQVLKSSLDTNSLALVRSTIWEILASKILANPARSASKAQPIPSYLSNKFALLITLLFSIMWPDLWPDFWSNVFALLPDVSTTNTDNRPNPTNSSSLLNNVGFSFSNDLNQADYRPNIDFFLRLCLSIDHEIVNPLIHRDPSVVPKYQLIKDRMREVSIPQMVQYWYVIVQAYISDNDLVLLVLQNVSVYISWIDVSLIVNDQWISLIMKLIHHQVHGIRIAAVECLIEIVNKGMKSSDKLQLLSYLQLIPLLQSLTQQVFPNSHLKEEDDQLAFIAQLGKLVNAVGCQILYTWLDPSTDDSNNRSEVCLVATQALYTLFPIYLTYYSDEWDHVHDTVMDMTTQLVNMWKTLKKSSPHVFSQANSTAESTLAQQLFQATITKMQYHPNQATPKAGIILSIDSRTADTTSVTTDQSGANGDDDEEDEDVIDFAEQRRALKLVFDSLAQLIPEICTEHCSQLVTCTMNNVQANMSSVRWNDAELCLHVLYIFGEALKVVAKVKDDKSGSAYRLNPAPSSAAAPGNPSQSELSPLALLLIRAIESGISSYPHPCIEPLFLEILVRYSGFFVCCPQYLPQAFNSLVTGIKRASVNGASQMLKARATYLLLRFIKDIRSVIAPAIEPLILSLADLLGPPPQPSIGANGSPPKKISNDLYEIISILVSHESIPVQQRAEYLKGALVPLMQALHTAVASARSVPKLSTDFINLGQHVATIIHAAGALGKYFSATPATVSTNNGTGNSAGSSNNPAESPWTPIFIEANQHVLSALEVFVDQLVVRDAARGCFQCTVKAMGSQNGFPLLPPLMRLLLENIEISEVSDLLSFIGQLIYQHRQALAVFLDELVQPVLVMVLRFLNHPPQGTDELMAMKSIRRSYFSFLGSLVTLENGMLCLVLVSETNLRTVPTVLSTVVNGAMDVQDRGVQKVAITLLGKLVVAWTKTPLPPHVPGSNWVAETMFPLLAQVCIEMPLKSCDLKTASTLAVIQDVAGLHKSTYEVRGSAWPEFLAQVYLPAIGCPSAIASEYANAVATLDHRKLAVYIRQFLAQNQAA